MRHSLCVSPDGKQVLSATFQPDSKSDSQFLSRLHKAFLFGDQVAFHAEGDEFRTVFKLPPGCEQTGIHYDQPIPDPIENSVEVVKTEQPHKMSFLAMVYCWVSIVCCSFAIAWMLAEFLRWLCSI